MSAYTKQAIKNSFLKLLNDRPLNQVTVKAIVRTAASTATRFIIILPTFPRLRRRSSPNGLTRSSGSTPTRIRRRRV